LLKPGDVVVVDFPGVMGIKRRPAVIVSSDAYHSARPDVILGLITSQVAGSIGSTDHALADWSAAGLRLPCITPVDNWAWSPRKPEDLGGALYGHCTYCPKRERPE